MYKYTYNTRRRKREYTNNMANNYTQSFIGKLDGKTIYDFKNKLDYNVNTNKKRVALLNKVLCDENGNPEKYFQEYFDDRFKVELNASDSLSHDDNVCRELENFGSYLINHHEKKDKDLHSESINKDSNQPREDFDTQNGRDFRRKELVVDINGVMVEKNDKNYKHAIIQRITSKDLKDEELVVVSELQDLIDWIKNIDECGSGVRNKKMLGGKKRSLKEVEKMLKQSKKQSLDDSIISGLHTEKSKLIKEIKEIEHTIKDNKAKFDKYHKNLGIDISRYKLMRQLRKHITLCKDDQIIAKDQIKGTIYFKSPLPDKGENDETMIDLNDVKHVRELLRFKAGGWDKWYSSSTHAIEALMKKIKLSKDDRELIHMLQNRHELNDSEIARELGLTKRQLNLKMDSISNRLIKKNKEDWTDWAYLNYKKGEYRECKVCGKIKLKQFFSKRNGEKYICKSCNGE